MSDFAAAMRDALPAGEWRDVQVLKNPGGMMARDAGTVHAVATWLRDGGVPAYLKCVPIRGDSAGPTTALLAVGERVDRLRRRLLEIKQDDLPFVVRILAVEQLTRPPALLIAMERVTPLRKLIQSNAPDRDLSERVLRGLLADPNNPKWIHFDICPMNIGQTTGGRLVFIDVDSMYPISLGAVEVSVPAAKPRLPPLLAAEWKGAFSARSLPRSIAVRKHNAETIVLGAECCLGLWADDSPDDWCARSLAPQPLKDFWKHELEMLAAGKVDNPRAVADRMPCTTQGASPKAAAKTTAPNAPSQLANTIGRSSSTLTAWDDFNEDRRNLRLDRIRGADLPAYRARVWKAARNEPKDARWWRELLVITVAYERNAGESLKAVEEALRHFPEDPDFLQDREVIRLWQT